MFGEEFERYKNLLDRKDQYLRLRAIADRPRWKDDGDYELKITKIELLSDVLEKYTKRIDLNIKLHDISSQLVDDLKVKVDDNLGNTPLNFQILGENNEILHLTLPRQKVNPKDFIHAVKGNPDIALQIIK